MQPVQKEVVWDNVLIAESMWAYPREQSAKQKMRLCYEQMTNEETRGTEIISLEQNVKRLQEAYSAEKMYDNFTSHVKQYVEEFDVENWLASLDVNEVE